MPSIISIPFQQKIMLRSQYGSAAAEDGTSEWELRPHPFLAGPENYVICSAVYDIIQETPNPFLIIFCAPPGSGKTHLSEGLLLSWLTRHPNGPGLCISAHEFAREWANAQRTRTPHEFFEKYQALEFVILEDLQEISTHPATQEQLVRLLDLWTRNQSRVLLTVNQPFSALPLNEKLHSRLCQGVTIPIHLPSPEVRSGLISLPEHSQNIPIPETVLNEFIKQTDQQQLSVGEMLHHFQKLVWARKTSPEQNGKTGILPPLPKDIQMDEPVEDTQITIAQIAKLAAKFYKIRLADLRSKSRKTTLVTVRDIIYFMARQMTNATLDEIGHYFNGRDHTTILHGCTQAEILIRTNEEVKQCIDYLYSELRLLRKQARFGRFSAENSIPPQTQEPGQENVNPKMSSEKTPRNPQSNLQANLQATSPVHQVKKKKSPTVSKVHTQKAVKMERTSTETTVSKKAGPKQTGRLKSRKKEA